MNDTAAKDRKNAAGAPSSAGEPELGSLPDYLGYALRRAQMALFRDFARRMAALDVTPGQFSLLTLIAANPGISQVALARIHRLDKSTLSPAVDRLARRGMIRRRRAQGDRRFYALSLTDAGARTLGQVTSLVEGQERAMADALQPGEPGALVDMLGRVTHALGRDPDPAG